MGQIGVVVLLLAIVAGGAYYFGKGSVVKPEVKQEVKEEGKEVEVAENEKKDEVKVEDKKEVTTNNLKTYSNKEFGIEFKYPLTASITEEKLSKTDLTAGAIITVSVPFKTTYSMWTSKKIDIIIRESSCRDYLPGSIQLEKKIINGISYSFHDPDWESTSGMSSVSKQRKYYHESSGKCYIISESISGLGVNEIPAGSTSPTDVDKFLNEELVDLDKIVASIKLF